MALWSDDTFVDFDRSLNFCVAQVRSALRDDSVQPVYLRTIPKRGYQFIAPVQRVLPDSPAPRPELQLSKAPTVSGKSATLAVGAVILALLVVAIVYAHLHRRVPAAAPAPIVAVVRFDNESGDPHLDQFSDALTDTVVEQLTHGAQGRFQVIGNALALRGPRDQRDLNAIATSLHASYVVLGQVQSSDGKIRVLAHLIRMPEQTHVWVVRMDRTLDNPMNVESEAAQKIASEFSARLGDRAQQLASFPAETR
jgi:TolB-like protein